MDAAGLVVLGRGRCRLERERIFARTWQYAGPAEQVSEPASFLTTRAGHVPVVVVRDRELALRAFVNVCRHRGHLVMRDSGCRETLQCPYHAWTYGLDGTLRRAPRSEREEGFDAAAFSLLPVAVDIWGPFVFVNPDPGAAPLAETLGELPQIVERSGLDFATLRYHSHHEWPIEANWKVVLENYLECYHCPVAHPGFSKVIDVDPDSYALSVSPTFSSQIGPIRASALAGLGSAPYVPEGDVTQSQYHLLWPNTTINIAPGPQNIALERWVPDGLGRTIEVTDYWFGADVPPEIVQEVLDFDAAGRAGGHRPRPLGAGRARLGHGAAGPADAGERAADRRLPAPLVRRGLLSRRDRRKASEAGLFRDFRDVGSPRGDPTSCSKRRAG